MNSSCDLEVGIATKTATQQRFMDKFQELLSVNRNPGITLTNVYKEMPITHPAFLCQVEGKHVELQTCELQLAAISKCKEAYIQSPLVGSPISAPSERICIEQENSLALELETQRLLIEFRQNSEQIEILNKQLTRRSRARILL